MGRRALITGITGQDGSYLAELLLAKGYEVYGLVRRASTPNTSRIDAILEDIHLIGGDLLDMASLFRAIDKVWPDEIYNLAAQSHVGISFEQTQATMEYNGVAVARLLEAIRLAAVPARFYQAGTSELFGSAPAPQSERTPFHPRSPYGVAKLMAHWATINYREAYHLHASNGLLFNHESPRRSLQFVTRKITRHVAQVACGASQPLKLGNLEARRDWGYAKDYVEAMWLMLQQPTPGDYVIATGQCHSVQDFLEAAFAVIGKDWQPYVEIDPALYRPAEVDYLSGNAEKARMVLGWQPRVSFHELVAMMVEHDIAEVKQCQKK